MAAKIGNTNGHKHGHAVKGRETRTYRTWTQMLSRCRNSNHKDYKGYGARGISVCDRWLEFGNFLADMGERPEETTIDRKDTNGNYCLSNCRWATQKQQHRNKRSNRIITYKGTSMCFQAWADHLNMSKHTLHTRLNQLGWSMERAVNTPVRRKRCQN